MDSELQYIHVLKVEQWAQPKIAKGLVPRLYYLRDAFH